MFSGLKRPHLDDGKVDIRHIGNWEQDIIHDAEQTKRDGQQGYGDRPGYEPIHHSGRFSVKHYVDP